MPDSGSSAAHRQVLAGYTQPSSAGYVAVRNVLLFALLIVLGAFSGLFVAFTFPAGAPLLAIPILGLFLIVIWALPSTPTIPSLRTVGLLLIALFVAISLWPNYVALKFPGLPWISSRRLIAAPLSILLLLALATSEGLRRELRETLRASKWLSIFAIGFFVVQLASAIASVGPIVSIYRLMDALFTWTAVFFAGALLFQRVEYRARFIVLFVIFGLMLAVLSIAEHYNQGVLWADILTRLPAILKADPTMVQMVAETGIDPISGKYRTKGIFTTSLSFAEYMALAAPFLLYLTTRYARDVFTVGIAIAANLLLIAGLYLNGSRLGLVGLVCGYALFGAIWAYSYWRANRNSIIGAAMMLSFPAGAAAFALSVAFVGRINAMFFGTGIQVYSTQARLDQFAMMPPVFLRRPILGYGQGMGGAALNYRQPGGALSVDSYIITALLDFGIVGAVTFFGMVVAGILLALRIARTGGDEEIRGVGMAAAAALITFLVIRFVLSQDDNHTLFFMILGMAAAIARGFVKDKAEGRD